MFAKCFLVGDGVMRESISTNNVSNERIVTRDFVLIWISNFFIFLGFQMTLPTLPLFVEKLGGNEQLIGLVIGIFTFSALLIRPYAGHALESKGRQFIYITGLGIFVISVGTFAIATSLVFLFFMRLIQGVGWGLSTTAAGTIATDLIPAERRGEGMGYYALSGNLALAFGPTLGLALVTKISFTQLFVLCAILGAVAFLSALQIKYKEVDQTEVKPAKFDVLEKTAVPPSILLMFITFTFGGITTFLPLYTIQKEVSGIEFYFLIYAIALMISRTFTGKIYDRRGHRAVFPPGTLLIIGAMFLLAWLPSTKMLFLAATLYGFGFGTVQPALQAWAVQSAAQNRKGMANATFFSAFDLGIGIGAILFGQIAFLFGYQSIYIISGFSVIISLLIYLIMTRKGRHKHINS